jgi:hypothetical protein
MANEVIQGDEWGTYGALGRTTTTKHGIAYGREPYGDGVPVVVAGLPCGRVRQISPAKEAGKAGHRGEGAGDSDPASSEVREMRTGATVLGIIQERWRASTRAR